MDAEHHVIALHATDAEHAAEAFHQYAHELAKIDPLAYLAIPGSEQLLDHYNVLAKRCFDAFLGIKDAAPPALSASPSESRGGAFLGTKDDLLREAHRATEEVRSYAMNTACDREIGALIEQARRTYQGAMELPIKHYVTRYHEYHNTVFDTPSRAAPASERGGFFDTVSRVMDVIDGAIYRAVKNNVPLAQSDTQGWFEANFYGHRVAGYLHLLMEDCALPTWLIRKWEMGSPRCIPATVQKGAVAPLPYTLAYCSIADAYVVDKTTYRFIRSTVDILVGYVLASKRKYVQNTVEFSRGIARTVSTDDADGIEYAMGDPRAPNTSVFVDNSNGGDIEYPRASATLAPHYAPVRDALEDIAEASRRVILDGNHIATLGGGYSGIKTTHCAAELLDTLPDLIKQIPKTAFVADYNAEGSELVERIGHEFKNAAATWETFALGVPPGEDGMDDDGSEYRVPEIPIVVPADGSGSSSSDTDGGYGTMNDIEVGIAFEDAIGSSRPSALKPLRRYISEALNCENNISSAIRNFIGARVAQYVIALDREKEAEEEEEDDEEDEEDSNEPYVVQFIRGPGTGEILRRATENKIGTTSACEGPRWYRGRVSAIITGIVLGTLAMGQFSLCARDSNGHDNDDDDAAAGTGIAADGDPRWGGRLRALYEIIYSTSANDASALYDDPRSADGTPCVGVMRRSAALMHVAYDDSQRHADAIREIAAVEVH